MKNELSQIISQSRSLVFFGGAGVSTESGIPDFRSVDGLYNQKYDYPPEQMLSHTFFERKTEDFYRFYRDKILSYAVSAKPNAAHKKLAELEEKGILSAVVTQNIDGLHQAAGSKNVFELHGVLGQPDSHHVRVGIGNWRLWQAWTDAGERTRRRTRCHGTGTGR